MVQNLSPQVSILEIEIKIADFLGKQGFEVKREAKLYGQSGIEHNFNLIATLDDFQHVVEGADQATDFILAGLEHAQAVILLLADSLRRARQFLDRL